MQEINGIVDACMRACRNETKNVFWNENHWFPVAEVTTIVGRTRRRQCQPWTHFLSICPPSVTVQPICPTCITFASNRSGFWNTYLAKKHDLQDPVPQAMYTSARLIKMYQMSLCSMLPYEVNIWRKSFAQQNICSEKCDIFVRHIWVFPNTFCWICNNFCLEPWQKMMRRGQVSFWRKQNNELQWN